MTKSSSPIKHHQCCYQLYGSYIREIGDICLERMLRFKFLWELLQIYTLDCYGSWARLHYRCSTPVGCWGKIKIGTTWHLEMVGFLSFRSDSRRFGSGRVTCIGQCSCIGQLQGRGGTTRRNSSRISRANFGIFRAYIVLRRLVAPRWELVLELYSAWKIPLYYGIILIAPVTFQELNHKVQPICGA